ncbi:hypothetical protein [Janthinobacterium agaricidamnosum]|uniref:hypothetical protein n=1 Tax=Janthinobacterium agaricidamnosum TaxID=55508 RepID=UPI000AF5872A|nr:hypothetical protein [Janthinobacterium agaricidamnosum]
MTKSTFSRSDVAKISSRMSQNLVYADDTAPISRGPASSVAAKVMRDVGVSREKMQQAYTAAKKTVIAK